MKFKNTLCPYSQVALKRCANVNQEHILVSALGGPDGLVIRCEALMATQIPPPMATSNSPT